MARMQIDLEPYRKTEYLEIPFSDCLQIAVKKLGEADISSVIEEIFGSNKGVVYQSIKTQVTNNLALGYKKGVFERPRKGVYTNNTYNNLHSPPPETPPTPKTRNIIPM